MKATYDPPLAFVTLDSPETLNSFTNADYDQLADTLEAINARADIYVTVWQAHGRYFSAGANYKARTTGDSHRPTKSLRRQEVARLALINDVSRQLYTHTKLLVAVLNGPAVGIAPAFLGHFDFVYATPSAWIAVPFSSLGMVAEMGSSVTFVNKLGLGKANEVLYWGKKIGAEELLATGFVNKLLPPSPSVPTNPSTSSDYLALSTDLHAQVRTYLLDTLGLVPSPSSSGSSNSSSTPSLIPASSSLDLSAILATKALIKAGIHEKNNPEAVGLRETYVNSERGSAGIVRRRFEEIAAGKRRHKL